MAPSSTLSFGVPQLDKPLGPIPNGSLVLLRNDPAVDAQAFLLQAADRHVQAGDDVLFLVTDRSPQAVRQALAGMGYATSSDDRLRFIDAHSGLLGLDAGAAYTVRRPDDLADVCATVERAVREHPGAVLLFDSLSSLIDRTSVPSFADHLPRLIGALRGTALTVARFTDWPYGGSVEQMLSGFDAVVKLRGAQEQRVVLSQYFAVERAAWQTGALDRTPRLYKSVRPGGVFVYIPKILVTGSSNAGKSTFVHAASDSAVSVDRLGTTVALDHGSATLDGIKADIFGTPGQGRFDPLLPTLAGQALGVILIVDSTAPESLPRAQQLLSKIWKEGLAVVVAANKQDLPGALPPEEIARRMALPPGIVAVGCSAQRPESSRHVLSVLVDRILTGGAS